MQVATLLCVCVCVSVLICFALTMSGAPCRYVSSVFIRPSGWARNNLSPGARAGRKMSDKRPLVGRLWLRTAQRRWHCFVCAFSLYVKQSRSRS